MKRALVVGYLTVGALSVALGQTTTNHPAVIRVACVGDSITAGGYPAVLGRLLGAGYEVKNLGVSGATLMKRGDFSYWNLGKIEEAEQFGPQIVTVLLGTNDAKPQNWIHKGTFLDDYKAIIEALQNLPTKPKVYVMIPVPVFGNGGFDIDGMVLRKEITPLIARAAKITGSEMINLYAPLANSPGMFPDNVHPNGDGNEAIAKRIYQVLTGAPVFEAAADVFLNTMPVRIAASGSGSVHYTLDGSEPSATSPVYKQPITLSKTTTINAVVIGQEMSPRTQATFTKVSLQSSVRPAKMEKGLAFDYYEADSVKALEEMDSLKPLRRGVMDNFQLGKQDRLEYWGYRWTGYITVPTDGLYTFHTTSDDGSRLWVGKTLVVENRGQHGAIERLGRIALKAGAHPITVTFYNAIYGWSLKVDWEGPGVEKQVIPASVLSHEVEPN